MNDIHSETEWKYKPRWIAHLLRQAVRDHPVVVLTGARQVGKSTLLKYEPPFPEWRYVSLDDFDVLSQARSDPATLWAGTNRIILDEVQRSANVLEAVKIAVDRNRDACRFLLSGSANLLLMKKVSESLAGRAVYFNLLPLTAGEQTRLSPPNVLADLFHGRLPRPGRMKSPFTDLYQMMWKGSMPPLMRMDQPPSVLRWWEGYVATYLERDLRQLSQIESLHDFRRFMIALALRCGLILNQTEVARDISISQPSVHRYLNLLETTCLAERLPAFAVNRTKRLMKSPKMMWNDTGLVCYLSGHYDIDSLRSSREAGAIFESMIYLHLKALVELLVPAARLFYWRTANGQEVDFVLEWGRRLLAVEVKLSEKVRFSDIDTLRLFLSEYPETSAGILLYSGDEVRIMDERIVALPWFMLGGSLPS